MYIAKRLPNKHRLLFRTNHKLIDLLAVNILLRLQLHPNYPTTPVKNDSKLNSRIPVLKASSGFQLKMLTFDDKSSCFTYFTQFDLHEEKALGLVTFLLGDVLNILEIMNAVERWDCETLKDKMQRLSVVSNQYQFKYRCNQKANETLQVYETDLARLD